MRVAAVGVVGGGTCTRDSADYYAVNTALEEEHSVNTNSFVSSSIVRNLILLDVLGKERQIIAV